MPNWCEGVLKVRGTKEKILEFLKNGIAYCDYHYKLENGKFEEISVPRDCPFKSEKWDFFIENTSDLWIKGTRRMFITSENIEGYWRGGEEPELICLDVQQAWAIDAENLQKLSQEYGLDFRIFGTEHGMEFCQLVEVIGGEITKDEEYTFDDFAWEVPDNRLGG